MKLCPSCGQDDETTNKCCAFCGYPGILPKESETPSLQYYHRWAGYSETSPDGRMLESNPQYALLSRAKDKLGLR